MLPQFRNAGFFRFPFAVICLIAVLNGCAPTAIPTPFVQQNAAPITKSTPIASPMPTVEPPIAEKEVNAIRAVQIKPPLSFPDKRSQFLWEKGYLSAQQVRIDRWFEAWIFSGLWMDKSPQQLAQNIQSLEQIHYAIIPSQDRFPQVALQSEAQPPVFFLIPPDRKTGEDTVDIPLGDLEEEFRPVVLKMLSYPGMELMVRGGKYTMISEGRVASEYQGKAGWVRKTVGDEKITKETSPRLDRLGAFGFPSEGFTNEMLKPEFSYSQDGKQLAVTGRTRTCLYDALTLIEIRCINFNYIDYPLADQDPNEVFDDDIDFNYAFTQDFSRVVAQFDKHLESYNLRTGQLLFSRESKGSNYYLYQFSHNGHFLIYGDPFGRTMRLLNADTGEDIRTYSNVQYAGFSQDDKTIIYLDYADNNLVFENLSTGASKREGPYNGLGFLSLSPDGQFIISRTEHSVDLYRIDQNGLYFRMITEGYGNAFFSSDGRTVCIIDNRSPQIPIWDVESKKLLNIVYSGEKFGHDSATISLEQNIIIASTGADISSANFRLADFFTYAWDLKSGKLIWKEPGSKAIINPDGKTFVVFNNSELQVRSLETNETLHSLVVFPEGPFDFSPDGSMLAVGARGGKVLIYSSLSGRLIDEYGDATGIQVSRKNQPVQVTGIDFSPDGKSFVVATTDGKVKIVDVNTGITMGTIFDKIGWMGGVQYAPDGKTIAISYSPFDSGNGYIYLWQIDQSNLMEAMIYNISVMRTKWGDHALEELVYSRDGTMLASGYLSRTDYRQTIVFDMRLCQQNSIDQYSRYCAKTLKNFDGDNHPSFSPTGKLLATNAITDINLWFTSDFSNFAHWYPEAHSGWNWSPDWTLIVAHSISPGSDDIYAYYGSNLTEKIATLYKVSRSLPSFAFSPNGNLLVRETTGGFEIWGIE